MRVLLADKLVDRARLRLASRGFEVFAEPGLAGEALVARIGELRPHVIVVRSTAVTREMVDAGPSLALVVRAGAGVNTIDLDACSERGIYVANCPGKNADAVAELAMGLILALDRGIVEATIALREGRWDKGRFSQASGLRGRTLGVLGLGRIGIEVARRGVAFGMDVVAWSRSLDDERAAMLGIARAASPQSLASRADVLTVHLAATQQTRGFVGEGILGAMKHRALLVNTSRAEVIDEAALRRALDGKGLRAGLDVFAGEPTAKQGAFDHPLAQHPSVIGTHHIGASTMQAQEAVADEACRVVEIFRDRGRAPNCVNLGERSAATHGLVVRHLDRVGVLAGVLDVIRQAHINVGEMENTIFAGGGAASARILVHTAPPDDVLVRMRALEHVLDVTVVHLSRPAL